MTFLEKFKKIAKKSNSLVCVGLDTVLERIPKHLLKESDPIFAFNKAIIEATYELVCAYKPNIAFYEAEGIKGWQALKKTCDYLKKHYPEICIILDAKRADIGHTNLGYIKMAFKFVGADAITIQAYPGKEAMMPFLELKDKFFFIWCKSSNPGAEEFQDVKLEFGLLYYQYMAKKVVSDWNFNDNCGLVVGATYPEELKKMRQIAGKMMFLIPGIGAQGGDIEKTIKAAKGGDFVVNSSRGIIYAGSGEDFAQKAAEKARQLRENINKFL